MSLFDSNEAIILKINDICSNEYRKYIFGYPNVIGFGFGEKIVKGVETGIPSLTFLVKEKLSKDKLSKSDIIPWEIDGIKTDVIGGENVPIQISACRKTNPCCLSGVHCVRNKIPEFEYSKYERKPIMGGLPCGTKESVGAGTIGCAVVKGDSVYLLTNNHVFGNVNESPIGTDLYYPSYKEGGLLTLPIAHLSEFKELLFLDNNPNSQNIMDAALGYVGKISDPRVVKLVVGGVYLLGEIKGVNENISIGDKVKCVGDRSGYTEGVVRNINFSIRVEYQNNRQVIFIKQIVTNNPTSQGDSGCIGLDMENRVFGLFFAAGGGFIPQSYFNPIRDVLSEFDVSIL